MITLKLLALSSLLTCSWGFESFMVRSLQQCENMEPGTHFYCDCLGSCDFTSSLNYCLKCALTYNIWQEYGDQVAAAASACGDNGTPSPSLAPPPNVSFGSTTASIAVIATTSSTVSSTSTQSHAATTNMTSGVVSSTTSTRSVIPSTSAAPSQVTGAAGSSKEKSNWYLVIGLIMIGLL